MTDGFDGLSDVPVPSHLGGTRLLDLVKIMARLRGPGGCPWDAEQTHRTLGRHLVEETYELLEAIESGDDDAIRDELGDVLLQAVFHAQIAADEGRWDIDDVAEGLARKLIHRHPHVFGSREVDGADEVLKNWERLKAEEEEGRRGEGPEGSARRRGLEEGIPAALPALARASKAQRRASGWGYMPPTGEAADALQDRAGELAGSGADVEGERDPAETERVVGEALFALVTLARAHGVDAETALRAETARFAEGYAAYEALAAERGIDLGDASDEELAALAAEARRATRPER